MPDNTKKSLNVSGVLKGTSPLALVAQLVPVANLDRFQPAGFPEVGHVIYKAPRADGREEHVCILDSAASMANHLESVCLRGAHDVELAEDLAGMPYLRCVTGDAANGALPPEERETVVTSLTEGHRIASTYFLDGQPMDEKGVTYGNGLGDGERTKKGQKSPRSGSSQPKFQDTLAREFGLVLAGTSRAHPPAEMWWNVFKKIFRYDPNALIHGVLFPQWQIKIPRVLTAHLEALGASRVDRSGVKFDRLGKTTSGQPIFAVDDAAAREIRATFILDLALLRSFGRQNGGKVLGLTEKQKEFLVALAFWKIKMLLTSPFRFRSGCHLECVTLKESDGEVDLNVDIKAAITSAEFTDPRITDVFWPREELYREGKGAATANGDEGQQDDDEEEVQTDA